LNVPPPSESAYASPAAVRDADLDVSASDVGSASSWIRSFRPLKKIRVLGKVWFGTVSRFEDPLAHDVIVLEEFDRCEDVGGDFTRGFVW
jgi:hypothetical protein